MLQSSLQSLFFQKASTDAIKKEAYNDDQEFTLCPSTVNSCSKHAKEVLVEKWTHLRAPKDDGFASCEITGDENSLQSGTSSMQRFPQIFEPLSDPEDIPREICCYRRKRDWDLPRHVKIHWHRETNVKHFYGIHKWMGQLCYTVGTHRTVIGTIVGYELQPLSAVRKSGHGAVLLRSVDAQLYQLSLLAASTTLQSQTLWSDHWENLPAFLICNVYVPPPYRGLGLGLALVDDACRKPGRDVDWVLTAHGDCPALAAYFQLAGFCPHIFGATWGARWNDLKRHDLPRIANLLPHLPTSSLDVLVVGGGTGGTNNGTTTLYDDKDDMDPHHEWGSSDDKDEEQLVVFEETILANFRATTQESTQRPRRPRKRVW